MKNVFYFLIPSSFLITIIAGLFTSWLHRKITAKFQYRIGPRWYQDFVDAFRMFNRRPVFLKDSPASLFLLASALNFTAVMVVSIIVWFAVIAPQTAFAGDLIVILYLLNMPALSLMLGRIGRHARLMMAYELPFILSLLVPIILSGGIIKLADLHQFKQAGFSILRHPSLIFSFLAALVSSQAKLALPPFDGQAIETNIGSPEPIDYSGLALAVNKMASMVSLFVIPFFLTVVFLGAIGPRGAGSVPLVIIKTFAVVLLTIIIKNKGPMFKPEQSLRFLSGPVTAIAVISVILALLGF
jgi:NADH-quinone oxidoreductase subunit H